MSNQTPGPGEHGFSQDPLREYPHERADGRPAAWPYPAPSSSPGSSPVRQKKGGLPGWAIFVLVFGLLVVVALAVVMWAAVQIGEQEAAVQDSGVVPPAPAATAAAPEPAVDDSVFREMNERFPADQEAYLDGLLADARPVYMGQENEVLVAMGLGVCILFEQDLSTATVVDRIPDEYNDTEAGYIVGHAVRHLCPENIPAVEADLGGTFQQ